MALLKINRKGERAAPENDVEAAQIVPLSSDVLGVSNAASERIIELIKQKEQPDLYLRVAIRGGGCSGLSIHYEFVDALRSNDKIFEHNGAKVVVDQKSLSILGGATLHCKNYLGSKEFYLLNNPAAKQCSCGQSFSL